MSIDDELKAIVLENAKALKETDKLIKELRESHKESKKEFDERLRESQKKTDELNDTIKKVSKIVGGIGNNQGDVAEEFFYNSLKHKPRLAGIDYDFIYKNITKTTK